jgi:hypothetical protein
MSHKTYNGNYNVMILNLCQANGTSTTAAKSDRISRTTASYSCFNSARLDLKRS